MYAYVQKVLTLFELFFLLSPYLLRMFLLVFFLSYRNCRECS